MSDELRPIPGYEGLYAVTRDGRVWSYPKAPEPGKRGRKHNGRWIAPYHARRENVIKVSVTRDGRKRGFSVRKLVRQVWGDAS